MKIFRVYVPETDNERLLASPWGQGPGPSTGIHLAVAKVIQKEGTKMGPHKGEV